MGKEHRKIGDILVAAGLISEMQLTEALEIQKKSGELLGEILVAEGSSASSPSARRSTRSSASRHQPRGYRGG
jgi:hypothetical protein